MRALTVCTMAVLVVATTLVACSSTSDAGPAVSTREPLVVFLARHGEKVDASADPELSAAGRERAAALATTLRSAELDHVHSSDFIRTRETAEPSATSHGLDVALYDHRDLPALVEKLRAAGGVHLVVGHSTTTPVMAELLGGRAGAEIDEAGEYDRLYVISIASNGEVSCTMMRYGAAYDP